MNLILLVLAVLFVRNLFALLRNIVSVDSVSSEYLLNIVSSLIFMFMNFILLALALMFVRNFFPGLRSSVAQAQAQPLPTPEPATGLPEEEWHLYGI